MSACNEFMTEVGDATPRAKKLAFAIGMALFVPFVWALATFGVGTWILALCAFIAVVLVVLSL